MMSREIAAIQEWLLSRSSLIRNWRESSGRDRNLHPFGGNVPYCVVESQTWTADFGALLTGRFGPVAVRPVLASNTDIQSGGSEVSN
jgi:hypothetical protein